MDRARCSVVFGWRLLAAVGLLAGIPWGSAHADDAADLAEFKKLSARNTALNERAQALFKAYRDAKPNEQQKISDQIQELRSEGEKLVPRIGELAVKIFARDPKNVEAGEAALEVQFQKNHFEAAIKIGETLLAAGRDSDVVLNLLGVSYYATEQFAKAKQILSRAEKDEQLDEVGRTYLDACDSYLKLWPAEQEIRQKEAALKGDDRLPQVLLKTTKGDIVVELFEDQAPNTVANFISLVKAKKYDGTAFHRVIPNFMAQGGDPLSLDDDPSNDGLGGPGYTIKCECFAANSRRHFRGSLSMAHAGKDTGGSQFFLTHLPTPHLDPSPDHAAHTVFGRVVSGFDALADLEVGDKITTATVVRARKHEYKPVTTPVKKKS